MFQADAFADVHFSGNPAAVVLVPGSAGGSEPEAKRSRRDAAAAAGPVWPLSDEAMLKIAAENNLSETAFVMPASAGAAANAFSTESRFHLRWFTPTLEVPLCGHATLATSSVLYFESKNTNKTLVFSTASGDLTTTLLDNDSIEMVLPSNAPAAGLLDDAGEKACIKEITSLILGDAIEPATIVYSHRTKKLVLVLDDSVGRAGLEALRPKISEMLKVDQAPLGDKRVKGVIVTLRNRNADQKYHFISRYFAPWNGIPEDPVTGSAHSVLAPYWAKVLNVDTMFARQCSARGGDLTCTISTSKGEPTVLISGQAIVVMSGRINLPCSMLSSP